MMAAGAKKKPAPKSSKKLKPVAISSGASHGDAEIQYHQYEHLAVGGHVLSWNS